MLEGIRMLSEGWWLGAAALIGTLLLLDNRIVPAMFLVLVFGAVVALAQQPELARELGTLRPQWHAPTWALGAMSWQDLVVGTLVLALPQFPLTLGNAVIAVTEENNRLFPERRVDERRVAISTGVMNALGAAVGGVPMCHGAGGMAAHVRFGARTGGAPVIVGVLLLVLALFFRFGGDAAAPFPPSRSGRDPVPHRAAARAWLVRLQPRQRGAFRRAGDRGAFDLERRGGIPLRDLRISSVQAWLDTDLIVAATAS
jgi:hypothetical protein